MSNRRETLAAISKGLGRRELIWGGLRADDVEAISDLEQLAGSFAIIGGYRRGGAVPSLVDYEDLSGARPDLDLWDIEDHLDAPATHQFREAMLQCLAGPTALLPYRSSAFLSSIAFARRDRCMDLGLFAGHQSLFEHKPWVETELAELGIPQLAWRYFADEERSIVRRLLHQGPIMLRVSRSSGGVGLIKVTEPDLLEDQWPRRPEALVSVAAFLEGAIPLNLGATVWADGVTVNHPSVQLIGVPGCAARPFGYCGNDFGLVREVEPDVLDTIENSVLQIGGWLRRYGYLGTFGVDFLLHEGVPYFTEINPRFQGSTHASSQISGEAGESCVVLDHIAAILGLPRSSAPCLRDLVQGIPDFSHFVIHWQEDPAKIAAPSAREILASLPAICRVDLLTKPNIMIERGGAFLRITARTRVTSTGFDLLPRWAGLVDSVLTAARTPVAPTPEGAPR